MLALIAAALLAQQPAAVVRHFVPLPASAVPVALFDTPVEICDGETPAACRANFLKAGAAWRGDVNGDGVDELLVEGAVLGGTGGDLYYLFQRQHGAWRSLDAGDDALLLTFAPRQDILPIVRGGYHDVRISDVGAFKWNGSAYVPYADVDYRALSPAWFDASRFDEAPLFWAIRYRGRAVATFEPQWFAGAPRSSGDAKLDDPLLALHWVAEFKGNIYGVQDGRAFLLLPRPAYGGANTLAFDGDWLLVTANGKPVARYNRRTGELRVLGP